MKLINFDEIFKPVIRKLEINNLKDFRSEVFIDTPKWKSMIEKGQEIDINKDLCIYDDGTIGLVKEKSKNRRVILYIMNQVGPWGQGPRSRSQSPTFKTRSCGVAPVPRDQIGRAHV